MKIARNSILLGMLFGLLGCETPLGRNPLEGWKYVGTAYRKTFPFERAVSEDYQNYFRSLSAIEQASVDDLNIRFYESATKRAVEITVPNNGRIWKHVLIYDESGKRGDTIKYISGRYRS